MAGFTPNLLTKYEFCTLTKDTLRGGNSGVVKRSGAGLAAGETGDFDRLLQLLGESGWSCVGTKYDSHSVPIGLIFQRPISIPK